jgi:hypothetical protein
MPSDFLQSLTPLLVTLTGSGAGVVAYYLIKLGRSYLPVVEPKSQPAVHRVVRRVLTTPRYTRFAAIALSILISVASSGLLALIRGEAVLTAMDVALAVALAPLVNQFIHGFQLSAQSTDEPVRFVKRHIKIAQGFIDGFVLTGRSLSEEEAEFIVSLVRSRVRTSR